MARDEKAGKKACCLVSEVLEEAGIDRRKARQIRRQVLEGIVMLCQWQLERMQESAAPRAARKARRVPVE